MGDYIYILLLLAWVGFTLYNRSRKSRSDQQEKPRTPSWLEKSLQEMMQEETKPIPRPEEKPAVPKPEMNYKPIAQKQGIKPPEPSGKPKYSFEDEYEEMGIYSVEEDKSMRIKDASDIKQHDLSNLELYEDPDSHLSEQDDSNFDLRQAVIYAEILNKPYD